MLLTVLCQYQLTITCTHILWGPHEEHLTTSTALTLPLTLLTHTHNTSLTPFHMEEAITVLSQH